VSDTLGERREVAEDGMRRIQHATYEPDADRLVRLRRILPAADQPGLPHRLDHVPLDAGDEGCQRVAIRCAAEQLSGPRAEQGLVDHVLVAGRGRGRAVDLAPQRA